MAFPGRDLVRALGALVAGLRAVGAQPVGVPAEAGTVLHVLGCYAPFDSTGTSAPGRIHGAPAVVRLDTVTAAAPPDAVPRFALPADSAPRLRLVAMSADLVHSRGDLAGARVLWPHNRWSVSRRGDSLEVGFTRRFMGTVFVFGLPVAGGGRVAVGDTLAGRAREYRDAGPPHRIDHGRVTAVRVTCPAVGGEPDPASPPRRAPSRSRRTRR